MTDLSRLGLGDEPTTGLQGAEDCVQQCAVQGPEEHQASLTSDLTITLGFTIEIKFRVVGRHYFRLRLHDARPFRLHHLRKR